MITRDLALADGDRVAGIHLNMVIAGPPPDFDFATLTPTEQTALADMAHYIKAESGYAQIQGTKPQTLGYSLDDSPAGLAAWIAEKFRTWTDCDGDIERAVSRDELLTNIMLYWVTATAHSSARMYYETMKAGRFGLVQEKVTVPTGCAIFPRELTRPPRRWAEHAYNVTRWTEMRAGGHFAALEQPDALVADIRAFFRTVR
jgi:pimeloyl-ACP methyl ester carboxylesterase